MSAPVTDLWYWAPFTEHDHSGGGWILGITALIVILLVTALRLILRRDVYGWDDAFICSALMAYTAQHAMTFHALRLGLGRQSDLPEAEQDIAVAKAFLASDVLAFAGHYLAKLSIAWFIRRLFFKNALVSPMACNYMLGGIVLCAVMSVTVAGVARFPLGILQGQMSSASTSHSWTAITALDVLNELALAGIPTFLVVKIMKKGRQRTLVSVVFLSRLPLCAFSILHLTRVQLAVVDETNIMAHLLECSGTLEILLIWSLISASIPALKSLVQPFNDIKEVTEEKGGSSQRSQGVFFYRDR
ncbi:hypothetical protein CAC42_1530 [Sphaceloma murrayae]|uniref:Rhodopsin domain-containing protein n=1 Tax=Sphaceloma murrayae TaxID=2082308 RepID=A0A2K1R302_9PEZI|nr:hypothetical protein CAC42_1530 [Sphaceloma murrayae]